MARDLSGKVIVITGASAGIGAATAIECARAGMDVVLNARRAERLEAVAADVRSLGRTAEVVPGDITDRKSVV
jgi:NADP-dependent 3-hydroxy acid dehydrogenase YdfG